MFERDFASSPARTSASRPDDGPSFVTGSADRTEEIEPVGVGGAGNQTPATPTAAPLVVEIAPFDRDGLQRLPMQLRLPDGSMAAEEGPYLSAYDLPTGATVHTTVQGVQTLNVVASELEGRFYIVPPNEAGEVDAATLWTVPLNANEIAVVDDGTKIICGDEVVLEDGPNRQCQAYLRIEGPLFVRLDFHSPRMVPEPLALLRRWLPTVKSLSLYP